MGALLVVLAGVVYFESYLGLMDRWWFEDDPALYIKAREPDNPLKLFTDPRYLHSFGRGNNAVPVHMLSYWIDTRVPHFSWWTANAHNLISMLLVMLTLHHVAFRLLKSPFLAFLIPVTWMLIPSTTVVIQYSTTRHYVEGFLFFLWALIAFMNYQEPEKRNIRWLIAFMFFAVVASLAKEIYAVTIPVLFGALFLLRRRYEGVVGCAGLAVAYGGYRYWMMGADISVRQAYLSGYEYIDFLKVFPILFSAGITGYVFYALVAESFGQAVWRGGRKARITTLVIAGVVVLNLAAIYPVSRAIMIDVDEPNTWYRAVFFIHSLLLLSLIYLHWQFRNVKQCTWAVLAVFAIVLPSISTTRAWWEPRTERARAEGMFYLQHSDKLLYSEEPAHWYIRGLHRLYHCSDPHSISRYRVHPERDQAVLGRFDTVWRFQDGEFRPDASLYRELLARTPGIDEQTEDIDE